jgi:hypothetical protein
MPDATATPWDTKLRRAHRHLEELRDRIDRLKNGGILAATTDQRGRERRVRLVLREDPPAELSAIVGDVLHNARSALDCLAFGACTAGAAAASEALTKTQERQTAFPITTDEEKFREHVRERLPCASEAAVEVMRTSQPYYLADMASMTGDQRAEAVEHDELNALHRLWNIDKHRRLHLIGAFPDDIYAVTPEGVNVLWQWSPGPWVDGSEIGCWILPAGHEETEISAKADVIPILQEHLDLGWTNVDVVEFLDALVHRVEVVAHGVSNAMSQAANPASDS